MRCVQVLAVGKLRDPDLRGLCDEYYRRCRAVLRISEREERDTRALAGAIPARGTRVMLDERGQQFTSKQFAERLWLWTESSEPVVFVIGGADGLDDALRARGDHLLSLGKMTLAHRLARVVLAEQIYRAVSIQQGAPYHR